LDVSNKLVEHQGIAPYTPAWKVLADGKSVCLWTPIRGKWSGRRELHPHSPRHRRRC